MYAFVLRRTDWREQDQIVTLYTLESGKVDCLVRGVKKILSKNSAYLLPVFLVEADILFTKESAQLIKAIPVVVYKNILEDLKKISLLQTVFRWLGDLVGHERDERIFFLIKNWLEFLDKASQPNRALAYGFLGNILNYLGFAPELENCVFCQNKNDLTAFYPSGGGVVCRSCYLSKKEQTIKIYPLRVVDLKAVRLLFNNHWEEILTDNTEIANRLVFLYAQYHSERKLAKIKLF